MEKQTLIMGAAGFIGTNLTLHLLQKHRSLVLFDRQGAVFADEILEAEKAKKIIIKRASFTEVGKSTVDHYDNDRDIWLNIIPELGNVDTVYHLISTTCPSNTNQNVAIEMQDNLISTITFLDVCVRSGVRRVIFLSSGGTVYGSNHTGICKEEQEAFPITVYGLQKLSIEKILYLYNKMYHLEYKVIRLANPYGPYQRPNGVQGAISTFTWRAMKHMPIQVYGDGSIIRDYIYIDDAVKGIAKIANADGNYNLYNLGSGIGHSIIEVIDTIKLVLGVSPIVQFLPGRPVDVPVNILDISRFEKDYGRLNVLDLYTGIKKLAEFYEHTKNNLEDSF